MTRVQDMAYHRPMNNKSAILRHRFQTKPILRVVGAHHGLGAKLIERNGFDGVWASGLEVSTAFTLPDANILTMTENLQAAAAMNDATDLPVICDCDTGYGNAANVSHMVKRYEAAGLAAVVIEDKLFPKVNSFIPGRQDLAPIEEFMGKIEAAKNAQRSHDFMVFARIEALIAGWGMEEALRRAYAYAEAGADGLVIHSKATTPDEIYDFSKKWKGSLPIIAIPTTYYNVKAETLAQNGIRMVIYANHGLRASIRAMDEVFRNIQESGSTADVEHKIASMKEVFDLQGMSRFKEEESRFSKKNSVQALIPAAGDPRAQSDLGPLLKDGPVCMLPIGGKTLLDHQMDTLRSCGVSDIVVIGGYGGSKLRADGATVVQNPDFERSGVVGNLMSAESKIRGRFIMAYSDIVFDREIADRLLDSPHDITIVIDRAYKSLPARSKKLDLVQIATMEPTGARQLGQTSFKEIQKIGHQWPGSENAKHEFIGMILFREDGWETFRSAWHDALKDFSDKKFYDADNALKADVTDVLQRIVESGEAIHGLEIDHGWSEIHSADDVARVRSFFQSTPSAGSPASPTHK